MDEDLILIFGFVTVMTVIIGFTVNRVVGKVLEYKREKREFYEVDANTPKAIEAIQRQQMIEDRLQVLERLATDRGTLLADEIEKLRDERSERELG